MFIDCLARPECFDVVRCFFRLADVHWKETNQTREGYACGSVSAGGKTRAFHLAALPSNAILPKPAVPGDDGFDGPHQPLALNSQRQMFSAYPAE